MSKIKRIEHESGSIELERIIDDDVLTTWSEWNPLAYEASILWLEDVQSLDYVRCAWINYCTDRRNKLIPESSGRVIGYSRLTVDAPQNPKTHHYTRRVFYLLDGEDGRVPPNKRAPSGTVDPRSIEPSVMGEILGLDRTKIRPPMVKQWKAGEKKKKVKTAPEVRGALYSIEGGWQIPLDQKRFVVGSAETSDIILPYADVAPMHCRLDWNEQLERWSVVDENSVTNTHINDQRLLPNAPQMLGEGDILTFASHKYKIHY